MQEITKTELPNAVDLEMAVIGAMLVDTRTPDVVLPIIKTPDAFYHVPHKHIYVAITELYRKGIAIDILTVSDQLKQMKKLEDAGGDFELINLVQKVASGAHVEHHAHIVMQQFLRRMIIMFNNAITGMAMDDSNDVLDLLSRWQKEFDKVADLTASGRKSVEFPDALEKLKMEIEHLSNKADENELVGISTGFKITDNYTGGYRSGDLVIVAARPGMGKTAKVLKTAVANVRNNIPVGFISLEMSAHQLTARTVAIDTDFHLNMLLKKGFDKKKYWDSYDEHQQRMKNYPIYIDDSGAGDINDIVMIAKRWKRMHGMELLIIDYLQLMGDRSNRGNRENEVSSISRRLKLLAKELEIPIIVLSQLSRGVEQRGGFRRPGLHDLRESGAIEQDADIVEFIYRPGYYGFQIDEMQYQDAEMESWVSMGADTEIIYAKYRGGGVGTKMLKWIGDKTRFVDVTDGNDVVNYIDGKHNQPFNP